MRESLREQLEKVRPLPHVRLRNLAIQAVKSGDRSLRRLDDDPEAALALFKVEEIELKWAKLLDEVAKEIGGASRGISGSQVIADRPSEQTERRACHSSDRPATNGSGPSQSGHASQEICARPAPRPKAPAPRTKISRGAVLSYVSGVFSTPIGAGKRPVGQVTWGEVPHLHGLRANDALAIAEEVVVLNALRPFLPDDPKSMQMAIGEDPRRAEIEAALSAALERWREIQNAMRQRPVGDLERTLLTAASQRNGAPEGANVTR